MNSEEKKLIKKSLCESNPYLRDPEKRWAMLTRNAYESSVFEGAKGLESHPLVIKYVIDANHKNSNKKKSL